MSLSETSFWLVKAIIISFIFLNVATKTFCQKKSGQSRSGISRSGRKSMKRSFARLQVLQSPLWYICWWLQDISRVWLINIDIKGRGMLRSGQGIIWFADFNVMFFFMCKTFFVFDCDYVGISLSKNVINNWNNYLKKSLKKIITL